MACQDLLFVGVHEVADPSGGKLARRVGLTERSGHVRLERDAFTVTSDREMKLEFLGRQFDCLAVHLVSTPVRRLAFAILHRVASVREP
jgi:hypothetical protein